MSELQEKRRRELERIKKKHGILHAKDVVEFARNEKTALHSAFEWDDTKAAQEFRLYQARKVIAHVMLIDNPLVPQYISVKHDRYHGGGYHDIDEIRADEELHRLAIQECLDELERLQAKYNALSELGVVFKAADRVRKKHAKQTNTRKRATV
jgi:hypothetical protein